MNSFVSRKSGGTVKYRFNKDKLPIGTDVVHYMVPVEVNGQKTQEIPVSELEAHPAKYHTMFPQYIDKIKNGNPVVIKVLSSEFKVKDGAVVKNAPKRTIKYVSPKPSGNTSKEEKVVAPNPAEEIKTPSGQADVNNAADAENASKRKK